MKWVLIGAAIVAVIVILTLAVGWSLPVAHVASRHASFRAPSEVVWKAITEPEAFPAWRADVKSVERLPDREGRAAWIENGSNGRIAYEVERIDGTRSLVVRIADRTLPFGGTWTYDIGPSGEGCTLTITENGEVYNPVFRVMARYVFGYESTMAAYLESLRRKVE
jgi:uncharacterized protein YndB with AHSA1/START domain